MQNSNLSSLIAVGLLGAALVACGDDATFLAKGSKRSNQALTGSENAEATDAGADGPGDAADAPDGATEGDTPSNDADADDQPVDVEGAEADDLAALHKCLAQWKNGPFKGTVNDYQKISASVMVGGFGNAVNDTEQTDRPFLILIDASVSVFGSPTYKLLNKNGYYCMKVNVNVATALNVELHCNARLADQRVNVSIGSNQSDTTSGVGVHVLSDVKVNVVRPAGDQCIR